MHPAGLRTGSVCFWCLNHPCDEIMPTMSVILLQMNAGMHRYTHAEQHWRMSSRSTTDHPGLICLKVDVCWMEPSPSLSVGDDDPQAWQTSVTAPPLWVWENDLLSFWQGKHLFPLYHRWPTKQFTSAALHLTAWFLCPTRGLNKIS